MTAYYNEISRHKAATSRILMEMGVISKGTVDERRIEEVTADDIRQYTQHHFFAGAGGWSIALRHAGWPDDLPVFTGSCPCQSYSASGKQLGKSDPRHLWPAWFKLITAIRPPIIFGEQVATAIKHQWLCEVSDDLRAEGYTIESFVLPSKSVSGHNRERVFFMAYADGGDIRERLQSSRVNGQFPQNSSFGGSEYSWRQVQARGELAETELVDCRDGKQRQIQRGIRPLTDGFSTRDMLSSDISVEAASSSEEARLDRIHIYGDAIQVELAELFIRACMEVLAQ